MAAAASVTHTVFVVGAGASLGEAQARRPKQQHEHPPLDANFFRRKAYYRPNPLYTSVKEQATRLGVSDLARDDPPVGLEDYLGRLYFNVQHNPRDASVQAYFQLIDLYAWEVIETTRWMIGKKGLMTKVFQREIAAGHEVSIITFNIDLLLENALERLAHSRPGAAWGLGDAYGLFTSPKPARGSGEVFEWSGESATRIPIYKMHGSVNWVFQTRNYYPPADLVGKSGRDFWLIEDRRLPGARLRVQSSARSGRNVWYAFPLIVPPVYEKHAFIRMHLQEVWGRAEQALRAATNVVFWGYSFPVADTHARHFFQGLADQNPVLRRPVIVNPDPAAASALWSLLRADRVTQYRSAEHYLDEDSN